MRQCRREEEAQREAEQEEAEEKRQRELEAQREAEEEERARLQWEYEKSRKKEAERLARLREEERRRQKEHDDYMKDHQQQHDAFMRQFVSGEHQYKMAKRMYPWATLEDLTNMYPNNGYIQTLLRKQSKTKLIRLVSDASGTSIPTNMNTPELKRTCRMTALKFHPDKGTIEEDKARRHSLFVRIFAIRDALFS